MGRLTFSNTGKTDLTDIAEGLYISRGQSEEWYAHFMLQQSSDPTMTLADFWEIYKADRKSSKRYM